MIALSIPARMAVYASMVLTNTRASVLMALQANIARRVSQCLVLIGSRNIFTSYVLIEISCFIIETISIL